MLTTGVLGVRKGVYIGRIPNIKHYKSISNEHIPRYTLPLNFSLANSGAHITCILNIENPFSRYIQPHGLWRYNPHVNRKTTSRKYA